MRFNPGDQVAVIKDGKVLRIETVAVATERIVSLKDGTIYAAIDGSGLHQRSGIRIELATEAHRREIGGNP
jgi:hypothetical protein